MGTGTGIDNFKLFGRPNFTYAESLVKFGLQLAELWIHEKAWWTNGQLDKRTNGRMDGQLPNLYKDAEFGSDDEN